MPPPLPVGLSAFTGKTPVGDGGGCTPQDLVALLVSRIEGLVSHYDSVHRDMHEQLLEVEDRLAAAERLVYTISGGVSVLAFLVTLYVSYLAILKG